MWRFFLAFMFTVVCVLSTPAAHANKLKDCAKLAAKTGIDFSECLLGSSSNAGGAQAQDVAPQSGPPLVCDISAEPKPQGDWSFQACVMNDQNVPRGIQCMCRSQATGISYGGIVR